MARGDRRARADDPSGSVRRVGARLLRGSAHVGVHRLTGGVWLWQWPAKRLRATRVGPPKADAFLLADPARAHHDFRAYHQALGDHLLEQMLATVLEQLRVDVVLDVGANGGQFGRLLRSVGYTGRIVSYEPVSTNLDRLRETTASDPHWLVEDFALGAEDSTAEINVSAGPGKLSSLLPSNHFGRERFVNLRDEASTTETIEVRRLDAVLDRAIADLDRPRIFLKLDTQGYDLLVLAGAGDRLQDVVALQSEVSCIPIYDGMPHMTEQIAAYEQAGFAIVGMYPVSRDTASLAVIEFDVLMVRRALPQASWTV